MQEDAGRPIRKACLGLAFLFLAAVVALLPSPLRAEVLELSGPAPPESVSAHISYLLDPDHALSVEQVSASSFAGFQPLETLAVNVGYTDAAIWLKVDLRNVSPDTTQWVANFHDNFKQEFAGHILRADGSIDTRLSLVPDSPFHARPLDSPQMAMPFELAPGEEATLVVRYWTEGSSAQLVSIETQDSFEAQAIITNARNFAFYGIITAFVVAAIASGILFGSTVALAYACYTTCVGLFIMHNDGIAFQYVYPNAPGFNNVASVVWGGGFIFFGAIYTRLFLRTRPEFPLVDIALWSVSGLCAVLFASALFIDMQFIKQAFVFVALLGLAVFVISGLVVARKHFREVRFFIIAWAGAVLASALMNLQHQLGLDISPTVQLASLRIVIVIDAALMGLAILDRYRQLRDARQTALEAIIRSSERNLVLSERVSDLQAKSAYLEEIALQRDKDFADQIHDLRQPLAALRLRVRNASRPGVMPVSQFEEAQESLNYLEALIEDYLARSGTPVQGRTTEQAAGNDDTVKELSLGEILSSVHEMFEPDAAEKGLDFRFVPCSRSACFEPLALMRVTVNLVANAIRYTDRGKVLLGCRSRPDGLRIEIHDTGPGLNAAELRAAFDRDIRLEKSDHDNGGTGNGLAIALELADRNGWRIEQIAVRPSGTSLGIVVPATREN